VRASAPRACAPLLAEVEALGLTCETSRRLAALGADPTGVDARVEGTQHPLRFDHVVVNIGRRPRDRLIETLVPEGQRAGRVTTDLPGLYLAGDLIRGRERYVATAFGDGQRAAVLAAREIERGTA